MRGDSLSFFDRLSDGFDERFECSRGGPSQRCFELGKHLFDRIEVGAVGRQIAQRRAGSLDYLPDTSDFVRWQIVHDDNRAGSVCLNSRLAVAKWISAMVMVQPGLAAAQRSRPHPASAGQGSNGAFWHCKSRRIYRPMEARASGTL